MTQARNWPRLVCHHWIMSVTLPVRHRAPHGGKNLQVSQVRRLASLFLFCLLQLFSARTALAGVDLVVNISDSPDPVPAGGVVTYPVRVSNNGNADANNISVVLDIPANSQFLSATGSGVSCGALVGTQVTCNFGTLVAATATVTDEKTVNVDLQTVTAGAITLTASATSDGPEDAALNNTASEPTTVDQGADLSLSISGPASAQAGDTIDYSFTVTNNGPDQTTSFRISDPVPAGFDLLSLPAECNNNAGTIECDLGPLAAGNSQTVTSIHGQVSAGSASTLTNSASVSVLSGPADPDTANNTATFDTTVTAGSDVAIQKSRSVGGDLLIGDTLDFVLSPSYTGDSPNGLTVTDTVPAEYTIDAAGFVTSQNGWSCAIAGQTVTCTKASGSGNGLDVSLGDIVIPVTATTAGNNVTNTVSISSTAPPADSDPANNTADDGGVNIIAPNVDLGIQKTGPSPALSVVGVPFNYRFTVNNSGTTTFTGPLTITDNLPAGLTLNAITTANGWNCSPASGAGALTITCDKAGVTIVNGDSHNGPVIEVVATVTGAHTNVATISTSACNIAGSDCLGDSADDSSSYGISSSDNATSADLSVLKTVDLDPVPAGDVLTYTLEIVNTGPSVATNIDVTDRLVSLINNNVGPNEGYISESFNANGGGAVLGSCSTNPSGANARRLNCTLTTLPVCTQGVDCPTITAQVRPGGNGGTRSNTAEAFSQDVADPDTANNRGSVNSNVDPRADVSVSITDTPDPAFAGQSLTYVITASNAGPSQAENTTISDTLPNDVTFVSATPSAGSCTTTPTAESTTAAGNNTLICNLGTVDNGSQQTVTVVVRPNNVTRGSTITYNSSVSTTTIESGAGNANNTVSATTTINDPLVDLIINLVDDVDPVAVTDTVVYTVTVTNNGPSTSENVVVTDTLPAPSPDGQLSFQSVTLPAGVTCPTQPVAGDTSGANVICNLGNLLSGESRSFDINLLGVAKGIASTTAVVTSDEEALGFETNPGNNSTTELTTVRSRTDMEVFNKQPQDLAGNAITSVDLREDFRFLIQVRNNLGAGLAEADDVVVSDTFPAGMELTGPPGITVVSGTTTLASCTGAAADTSFSCNLGTVSNGAQIDIVAPVQVITAPGGVLTNTATVSTSSLDIDAANDSGSGTITNGNVLVSSIAGTVFRDFNDNGSVDAATDTGIANITLTLSGNAFDGAPISATATTDANGDFLFANLPASDGSGYRITEQAIADPQLNDGKETAGSLGGDTTTNDRIAQIVLPADTDATGYLFAEVPVFAIGTAKAAGALSALGDGTHEVSFSIVVVNSGATSLDNVQIEDDLAAFGTYQASGPLVPGTYTISSAPAVSNQSNNASLTADPAFTGSGSGKTLLLAASSQLPDFDTGSNNASQAQVDFTVRFFPASGGVRNNQVTATARSTGGQTVSDLSVDGTDPDGGDGDGDPGNNSSPTPVTVSGQSIAVTKTAGTVLQTGIRAFDMPYRLVVSNPSATLSATFVQLDDDLGQAFPTAETISVVSAPQVSQCTGSANLTASSSYDGVTQTRLLDGTRHLLPGEQCQLDYVVHVDFGTTAVPASLTNTVDATVATSAGGTPVDTDRGSSTVSFANLATVSGRVWKDVNHDRQDNNEPGASNFDVEVLNSRGDLVGRASVDANGDYTIGGLLPSTAGNADTFYQIRFVDSVTGILFGRAISADPVNPNGQARDGKIVSLPLSGGVNTINQSLPLDPSGIIYDSITRQPVSGVQITLSSAPAGFDADKHLVGGAANLTQTTGNDGFYQFLLQSTAPKGTYTLAVTPPAGYLPGTSASIPVCNNTLTVQSTPDPLLVQNTNDAPGSNVEPHDADACASNSGQVATGGDTTQYYLSFELDALNSADVVNNHIPVDLITDGAITTTKSTPRVNVSRGDLVPYTVTATNNFSSPLTNIDLVDQIPPGFKYKPGSASMDNVALEPAVNGRSLRWAGLSFAANEQHQFKMLLTVGGGATEGEYVNQAWAENNLVSQKVSNIASATVHVVPDPTFDCSDIIGKVFDDRNLNGYPDDGEEMLPDVRLATARGWLVTTDDHGRYHITCATIPNGQRGSNFIIKLDERTLPSGYRLTTENPRVVRLTRGKVTKANFGATIHRVVRLDLSEAAFEAGTETLAKTYVERFDALFEILKQAPSVLRLNYLADFESPSLAENRLQAVKRQLAERWQQNGCCYNLILEEEIYWRTGQSRSRPPEPPSGNEEGNEEGEK